MKSFHGYESFMRNFFLHQRNYFKFYFKNSPVAIFFRCLNKKAFLVRTGPNTRRPEYQILTSGSYSFRLKSSFPHSSPSFLKRPLALPLKVLRPTFIPDLKPFHISMKMSGGNYYHQHYQNSQTTAATCLIFRRASLLHKIRWRNSQNAPKLHKY